MARPSDRIQHIADHLVRIRYLDNVAAKALAIEIYLDEESGYHIQDRDPIRLAEMAAGVAPLVQ